ncbi:probable polygalacturonase At3g15720 [Momordica charantia]|uniref:Probable polygalacturonase At3g15720 n=1 Tax=Momordica charantia TaxID=3673 RepID=A0A6J1CIX8_MOMCH|nr:probable polygalacturonase At3g15720 [Momordica charantia]
MKLHFVLLFIFSINILSSWIVSASPSFNVLDYGAIGNGQADDSQAFLRAWNDVCGATEGIPTLHAPHGKIYMLKPLKFQGPCKSKQVTFHLKGTLVAPKKGSWPKYDRERWIQFSDIDGLIVNGTGQFDGQGSSWWEDWEHCQRPTALFLHNCNGLQLREMKHINSAKNHISINACNDVIISDLHIIAPEDSPNTDGIDVSRSNNVLIQNSFMGTGDDCIALNNGSSNIDIVGVTCGPGHGISIGSLGGNREYNVVENIHVKNCLLKGTQNGMRIKTWQGGYGYARNITFEQITLMGAKNPIIIDQYYTDFFSIFFQLFDIKVSNVTYREVNGTSANENAIILNCSRNRCSNIILENVSIKPIDPKMEAKAFCQNVDGRSTYAVPTVPCLSN